mmetsp:Transcript_18068/g.25320  ORF Transcript_18068/g.25320 Transcript_18068/m.25320 type:complete len:169 (-) Transcript_18068:40-546(-)
MLQWRQETNIPEIYKWVEDNKEKYNLIKTLYPVKVHGFDKKDRPIVYDGLGMLPAGRFAKLVTVEDFRKYHIHFMEELGKMMRARTKKLGRAVFQLTAIVDMGGMNASHRHFIQYFKVISRIDQQYSTRLELCRRLLLLLLAVVIYSSQMLVLLLLLLRRLLQATFHK